ncbi:hypothetical protein [Cytobacillus gottheilii]|uniref:hypothetical protein n=1 Tax=Cytobacillus gottheilii TaxID=859144 RepID=UPI003464AB09
MEKAQKTAEIEGEIPTIRSKYEKKARFTRNNRKTSPYFHQKQLQNANKRKISAYLTDPDTKMGQGTCP